MSSLGPGHHRVTTCHSGRDGSGVFIPASDSSSTSPSGHAVFPRPLPRPHPGYERALQLTLACSAAAFPSHPHLIMAPCRLNASTSWTLLPPDSAQSIQMIPKLAFKFSLTSPPGWLRPPSPSPHHSSPAMQKSSLLASVPQPLKLTVNRDMLFLP